jgi:hypothetical protein
MQRTKKVTAPRYLTQHLNRKLVLVVPCRLVFYAVMDVVVIRARGFSLLNYSQQS